MILIAHRGNTNGPKKDKENSPEYLDEAIKAGFDVEIDVWVINELVFFGHDKPQYSVKTEYLNSLLDKAWIHCKNFEALLFFTNNKLKFRYFWHENDKFTLTSNNFIWTYPGELEGNMSIIVDLSKDSINNHKNCYGLCSDYLQ